MASKEYKAQLEAECHAGAAQGTAAGVAQCRAEGAECKVQLKAEFKVRSEAEYKGRFELCMCCLFLHAGRLAPVGSYQVLYGCTD